MATIAVDLQRPKDVWREGGSGMKRLSLTVVALLGVAIGRVGAGQADPLAGAWEVIYGQYGLSDAPVEIISPEHPVQLKVFASGRFAYVRHKEDGTFQAASAGSYTIDGDSYTETTEWSSVPQARGTRVTFKWRVVGDTVCMSGPVEVRDAGGKRVDGAGQMKELMRRAGTKGATRAACQ
jgi:hypothetical protein